MLMYSLGEAVRQLTGKRHEIIALRGDSKGGLYRSSLAGSAGPFERKCI